MDERKVVMMVASMVDLMVSSLVVVMVDYWVAD